MCMKKFNPETEARVYGKNHCRTIFKTRPEDIISLFLTKSASLEFKTELSNLAKAKKAYHIVEKVELEKLTKSTHHEDVCLVVKKKKSTSEQEVLKHLKESKKCFLLALENVSNPHNIGAIMRSMAHYGVQYLIVPEIKGLDSGALYRTAEGGAEFVEIVSVKNFEAFLLKAKELKVEILATTSHGGEKLSNFKFKPKSIVLFGEEGPGLSNNLLKTFLKLQIDGTGNVESLNVSVAASIIIGEFFRQSIIGKK